MGTSVNVIFLLSEKLLSSSCKKKLHAFCLNNKMLFFFVIDAGMKVGTAF